MVTISAVFCTQWKSLWRALFPPKERLLGCKPSEQARRPPPVPSSRWPGTTCINVLWQRVEDSPVSQTWVQISSPFLLRLCDFSEPRFPPLFNEVITYLIKFHIYLENKRKLLNSVPWCSIHVFSGNASSHSFSFNSPLPALTERSNGSEFEWERRKTIPGGKNKVS